MSSKSAPHRMREAHPYEFKPSTIFFYTVPDLSDKDWLDCFPLKAAAVYIAIYNKNATIPEACLLLKSIAHECYSLIHPPQKSSAKETGSKERLPVPDSEQTETGQTQGNSIHEDICGEGSAANLPKEVREIADAVFLIIGFLRDFSPDILDREKLENLCLCRYTRYGVADFVKLENQLPLKQVLQVVDKLATAIQNVDTNLTGKFNLPFTKKTFYRVLYGFCFYYSPFLAKTQLAEKLQKDLSEKENLLHCLHYSLVGSETGKCPSTGHWGAIPTAKQLAKSGIRFDSSAATIDDIKFSGRCLTLPELVYDQKLEPVLWNLVAWESFASERATTRYIQLLNELVEDSQDVRLLKRFGCVRGRLSKGEEVDRFVKMVDGFGGYRAFYGPVDEAVENVKVAYKARMGKFLARHQPAVILVSSVAASLVLTTAILAAKRRR